MLNRIHITVFDEKNGSTAVEVQGVWANNDGGNVCGIPGTDFSQWILQFDADVKFFKRYVRGHGSSAGILER